MNFNQTFLSKSISILILLFLSSEMHSQKYPEYTATVSDSSSIGYYFLSPVKIGAGAIVNPLHMILDKDGHLVYMKEFPVNSPTSDFKIQKNGSLTYCVQGKKYYIMDSTFRLVDSVRCKNGAITDTHDMLLLPNGHYLLMGTKNIIMDLSAYHIFNNNGTTGSSNATVICGVIQELDVNQNVVFEWNSKDHFSFKDADTTRLTNPSTIDWTHCNAFELDNEGNILLSSRHFNEITKINRSTGALMWRLGGNANQFTFSNDKGMFKGQHDIRRLANGNITLFDNGIGGPNIHPMAAKEYQLDESVLTAKLVWSYVRDSSLFSVATGNVDRISNGNTLVNYGFVNRFKTTFDVVKTNGDKVFEMAFKDTLSTYRALNFETLPWKIKQPVITCNKIGNQFYLDAGAGYSTYKWSTGDTSSKIPLTSVGIYSVLVPAGNGGYYNSLPFEIKDILNPCQLSAFYAIRNEKSILSTFPNPVTNRINIPGILPEDEVKLINSTGEKIWQGVNIADRDFSYLAPGLYFLQLRCNNTLQSIKFIKQ